jgi:hypothetical protein
MVRVLLDASFLIRCAEFKVDLYGQLARLLPGAVEFVALDRTIGEVGKVAARPTKEGLAARLALMLLRKKGVRVATAGEGHVDTLIVQAARPGDIVATQDLGLKRRLRQKGIGIAALRGKEHVILTGV